jgi:LysM repeat protein
VKEILFFANKRRQRWLAVFILLVSASFLLGCSGTPETVEVTRVVSEEVPVTVEVAQLVTVEVPVEVKVEVPVEVPVEVTKVVEVIVTATPEPTAAPTAVPTDTPLAPTETAVAGSLYTVQSGDTLASISVSTGTTIADIMTANGLNDQNFLRAGQELMIPGWDGAPLAEPTVIFNAPDTTPVAGATAVSGNLLPNPSFEEGWYIFNAINELQLPNGWSVYVDEGPNTLTDDPDDLYFRPEIRVVPSRDLPEAEHANFIFAGDNTIKAFKGGAPTNFAIFTDIALPAGTYRFTIRFFPDIVSIYVEGQKVWATDPLAAEVRFIQNDGGSGWMTTNIGTRNTMTYDFTVTEAGTVRLGAAFRNRYVNGNNGWFLDDWSLYQLGES